MLKKLLEKLRDRPILSIILCVLLSEMINLIILVVSKKPPTFHYGVAVVALLLLFVTPVYLNVQNKKKGKKASDSDEKTEIE